MSHLEIEYLDGPGDDPTQARRVQAQGIHLTDAWFAQLVTALGGLIAVGAVVVCVVLALTYTPSVGDPFGRQSAYRPESGVPPAAALVIGTTGLVLGLGLVSLGRLVASSAATLAELVEIRLLLGDRDPNGDPVDGTP